MSLSLKFLLAAVIGAILFASHIIIPLKLLSCSLPFVVMILVCVRSRRLFSVAACCALFFLVLWIHGTKEASLEGQSVLSELNTECYVQGIVVSHPKVNIFGPRQVIRFELQTERWTIFSPQPMEFPFRTRIQVAMHHTRHAVSIGDKIRVRGKVHTLRAPANRFEFNAQKYFHRKGIRLNLHVYGNSNYEWLNHGMLAVKVNRLRKQLSDEIQRIWGDTLEGRLYQALFLGDRSLISSDDWQPFRRTGTAHLLAVSGLHMTLFAGVFFILLIQAGYPFRAAAFICLCLIPVYIGVSGAGIPIQRAGWMAAMSFLAVMFGRRYDLSRGLIITACILLIFDSRLLYDAAFQLSFLAVLGLVTLGKRHNQSWIDPLKIKEQHSLTPLWTTVHALLFLLPLLLSYFGGFSPVSFIANPLAIPFAYLGLLNGAAALLAESIGLPYGLPAVLGQFFLRVMIIILSHISSWPAAFISLRAPSVAAISIYFLGLGGILMVVRKSRALSYACLLFFVLIFLGFHTFKSQPVKGLSVLNTKKGWLLVWTPPKGRDSLVFYHGPRVPLGSEIKAFEKYLRDRGTRNIRMWLQMRSSKSVISDYAVLAEDLNIKELGVPLNSGVSQDRQQLHKKIFVQTGDRFDFNRQSSVEVFTRSDRQLGLVIEDHGRRMLILPPLNESVIAQYAAWCAIDCRAEMILASPADAWHPDLWQTIMKMTHVEQIILKGSTPRILRKFAVIHDLNEKDIWQSAF